MQQVETFKKLEHYFSPLAQMMSAVMLSVHRHNTKLTQEKELKLSVNVGNFEDLCFACLIIKVLEIVIHVNCKEMPICNQRNLNRLSGCRNNCIRIYIHVHRNS